MYFEKFQDAKYEYEDRYGPLANFGYIPDIWEILLQTYTKIWQQNKKH